MIVFSPFMATKFSQAREKVLANFTKQQFKIGGNQFAITKTAGILPNSTIFFFH